MLEIIGSWTAEVWVALFGLLTTILGGIGAQQWRLHRATREKEESVTRLAVAERELAIRMETHYPPDQFVSLWDLVNDLMTDLLSTTRIDRILILRAFNGEHAPEWTTAIYQHRLPGQEPQDYRDLDLDIDYQQRLETMVNSGSINFRVADIPTSLIKNIYDMEGVTYSCWFLIAKRRLLPEEDQSHGSMAVTYCSFSTHGDAPIDGEVMTRCRLIVSRLKAIWNDVQPGQNPDETQVSMSLSGHR